MSDSPITAFQVEVARPFFALPAAGSFLLAGGLARAAHGLTDRPTEDLDAFTANAGDVQTAVEASTHAAVEKQWKVEIVRESETVLRVRTPLGDRDPVRRLTREDRATVITSGRDTVRLRFDDGRERTLSPQIVLRHLDYGYSGTTQTVQGQTSEIHVAALRPTKDAVSMHVSASRARERTVFVAEARDYLSDKQMHAVESWNPADLDDEVLDRVHAVLTRRPDPIDSPRRYLAPRPAMTSTGYGMSL